MTTERIRVLREQGEHEAALELALELAAQSPGSAELQLEVASINDNLGRESAAIPFYIKAIAGGLDEAGLRGAYLGLGSSYRVLGRYSEALGVLEEGIDKFPDAVELKVFRAMALYNLDRAKEAVASLLMLLAETSNAEEIRSYRGAIEHYASDLSRVWPDRS